MIYFDVFIQFAGSTFKCATNVKSLNEQHARLKALKNIQSLFPLNPHIQNLDITDLFCNVRCLNIETSK